MEDNTIERIQFDAIKEMIDNPDQYRICRIHKNHSDKFVFEDEDHKQDFIMLSLKQDIGIFIVSKIVQEAYEKIILSAPKKLLKHITDTRVNDVLAHFLDK